MNKSENQITPDIQATYLAMIQQLPGVTLFQKLYVTDEHENRIEVTENGKLSCAFVVSSVLTIFNLIDRPHGTVAGTVREVQNMGWEKTNSPAPGDLIIWPVADGHAHIGFYLGENRCISNSGELGRPTEHQLKMSDGREPEYFLTYDF